MVNTANGGRKLTWVGNVVLVGTFQQYLQWQRSTCHLDVQLVIVNSQSSMLNILVKALQRLLRLLSRQHKCLNPIIFILHPSVSFTYHHMMATGCYQPKLNWKLSDTGFLSLPDLSFEPGYQFYEPLG